VGASTALGEQHENPGVASIGFEFLMENALWRGRWREGLAYADQHGVLAEKASSSDRLAWNYLGRTFVSLGQGELARAEAFSREGLELADRLGDERLAVFLGSWQAQAVADAGRLEEATDLADRWIERADVLALKTGQIESRRVRAHIAQLAGDHAATLEYADQAEEILDGTDESIHPVWIHGIVCQALVATARLDEAETRLRATLEATRKALMPHWEGVAFKVRGLLNRARSDHEAAAADFDAGIAIFEELGSRLELARTLVLRGGDTDLARARELFEKCGALGDLAKLDRISRNGI